MFWLFLYVKGTSFVLIKDITNISRFLWNIEVKIVINDERLLNDAIVPSVDEEIYVKKVVFKDD